MKIKRILAYIIDIILISIIVAGLSYIPFLNPNLDNYSKTYTEYQEYNDSVLSSEQNINTKDFVKESSRYYYKLQKYSVSTNIIEIFCFIAYFVIFNLKHNGQTVGKKIMKIKIVSDNNELTWKQFLIRMIILNGTWMTFIVCMLVFILKNESFYLASMILTYINYFIIILDCMMLIFKNNNKSLHDILSKTSVVDA